MSSGNQQYPRMTKTKNITQEKVEGKRTNQRDTHRSFMLAFEETIQDVTDARDIMQIAAKQVGEHLDADRAGYAEIDESGEYLNVKTDWTSGHIPSLKGELKIADFSPKLIDELRTGGTVHFDDHLNSNFTKGAVSAFEEINNRAGIMAPLMREGQFRALFFVHQDKSRKWTPAEEKMTKAMASRTWDAVERARTEEALETSEQHYRTLFNEMDEGYCIIKIIFDEENNPVDYRFLDANPAFEELTGLEDWKTKTMLEMAPDHEKHWFETYGKVAQTGESVRFEHKAEHLPNPSVYNIHAFRFDKPEKQKVAILFDDITQRKRQEEDLMALNESLEARVEQRTEELISYQKQLRALAMQLSRAEEHERNRLASELHDNLGQMLAVIKMNVQNLQKSQNSEQLAKTVDLIDDSIRYTRELMSELKPPPSMKENNISAGLKWVINSLDEYNLEVQFINNAQNQPPVDKAIQSTIVKAVRELLFNTVKHADTNEAQVTLAFPDDALKIRVEDNGQGFDPDNTDFAMTDDSGFGLFHLSERIDVLGGQTDINAAPGEGTEVILTVPLDSEAELPEGEQETTIAEKQNKAADEDSPPQTDVLLVDDHEMMRDGLRSIIEEEDDLAVISEAEDAENAIDDVEQTTPDVVVMDINLPGMNGIEATKIIKGEHPDISIIGLSFHDDDEVSQKMYKAGASAYLTKTDASEELCAIIRSETAEGGGYKPPL